VSRPKPILAPFLTAKRKAPPVAEPEEIEDADYEEPSALAYSPGMEDDEDDTDEVEDGEEDKEPRYHDDPPEEAIEEQEDGPDEEAPKCTRDGCQHPRTPSPRKPEYQGLCKYHKDVLRKTRQQIDSKPKRRKATPEGTPVDKLGRLLAVVERLGGLEAAEKLAEVLNGLR
jgi:hypothetical protein